MLPQGTGPGLSGFRPRMPRDGTKGPPFGERKASPGGQKAVEAGGPLCSEAGCCEALGKSYTDRLAGYSCRWGAQASARGCRNPLTAEPGIEMANTGGRSRGK